MKKIYMLVTLTVMVSVWGTLSIQPASATVLPLTGSITGTVFRDINYDGTRNSSTEPGQGGIEITASCVSDTGASSGAQDDVLQNYGPVVSSSDGTFTFSALPAGKCRIESNLNSAQSWLYSSPIGAQTSSVQFVDASASPSVLFAYSNPGQYSEPGTPDVILASQFPVDSTATSSPTANHRALTKFPYNLNNTAAGSIWSNSITQGKLADASDVGSIWGVAYSSNTNTIYTSSMTKRYVGSGPSGADAIYKVDLNTNTTSLFTSSVDADGGQVPSNAARGIPNTLSTPYTDPAMFPLVGKTGWGDIEISDDGNSLYGVNLFDKNLYQFDVSNASVINSWPIPDPSCNGGSWRPWGLGVNDGLVFAGGVCDAFTSRARTDLKAAIFSLDPSTSTWSSNMLDGDGVTAGVQDFALNYARDYTIWQPWSDSMSDPEWTQIFPGIIVNTQPILSDIDFDNDGSAIISFKDRAGDQLTWDNAIPTNIASLVSIFSEGDILRARPTLDSLGRPTSFIMENAGVSPSGPALPIARSGGSTNNGDGPGNGEFYQGDTQPSLGGHPETSMGAALFIPGRSDLLFTSVDPSFFNSGGVVTLSNNDGNRSNRFTMYENNGPKVGHGKSSGLGDLEALTAPAPLELGNRVFFDDNKDGIQDPGEAPVSGVTVDLRDSAGSVIASAITDVNGNYLFSGQAGADRLSTMPGASASFVYDVVQLIPGFGNFSIVIPNAEGASQQSVLSGWEITTPDAGSNTIDSDGIRSGVESVITFTVDATGQLRAAGDNNHSFDFGFRMPNPVVTTTTVASPTTTVVVPPPSVKSDSGILPVTGRSIFVLIFVALCLSGMGFVLIRRKHNFVYVE